VLSLAADCPLDRPPVLEDFGGLRRAIAVAEAVELDAGGMLIVTAIEIWEHGLILHSAEQLPEFLPHGKPITNVRYREIADDLGTPYVSAGGSTSGSQSHRIGTHKSVRHHRTARSSCRLSGHGMRIEQAVAVDHQSLRLRAIPTRRATQFGKAPCTSPFPIGRFG
jgi:hypothetical protein